jgi:hypothetical protein
VQVVASLLVMASVGGASAVAQAQSAGAVEGSIPGVRADLVGLTAVPVMRQSFHSFCPFTVAQPSLTWVAQASEWTNLLDKASVKPPPYAQQDVDFASQRVVIIAAPQRPGPTVSMQVLKAPLAVAWNPAAKRLSVRVQETDAPTSGALMQSAVVGQPCLVLWLRFGQPVREVLARNTRDQLLGRQAFP